MFRWIIRILISLILILEICSCGLLIEPMPRSWNWGFRPRPLTGVRGFPPATTVYGKAFKDGCEVATDSVMKGLITDTNKKRYNYKMMKQDSDYDLGWWDGFEQCVYITDWDVL